MKAPLKTDLYRNLPSVDELLRSPEVEVLISREGHSAVAEAARAVLARVRQEIGEGNLDADALALAISGIKDAIDRELRATLAYSLRPVINATGVILHTNLGRAPLPENAIQHIAETATTYSNLEFDIAAGERGKRDVHTQKLFARLFAVEGISAEISTIVVNNNAAAVLLALNALAEGGEAVVSRGELVEIGGSFRIPDVMTKSGAVLREVGTTNRTRIGDYERAINERTRLLLRVHQSNFQMVGFTEQPSLQELVELGRRRGIPVMEDLGSGALFDLGAVGIHGEPTVADSLRAGVDVVTYSGDKLLGGPQAGLITGRKELVARIRSNPLFRALRVDKLTYAALEAVLLAYVRQQHDSIPAIRMMRLSAEDIRRRAERICKQFQSRNLSLEIAAGESVIGGGAAPSATLPTFVIAAQCEGLSADEFAAALRSATTPVITRVEQGRVLLDLRTVFPEQDEQLVTALQQTSGSTDR